MPRNIEQSPCSCFCDNEINKMADSGFLSIVCVCVCWREGLVWE